MGLHPFFWQGVMCVIVGLFAGHMFKITVSVIPNCLNCCIIFVLYTQFTSVPLGRIVEPGGLNATLRLRSGDPCSLCY